MANLFHTSLFGYSKASVNNYISKLNEEFSQKLLEKDLAAKRELQALQAETERLKAENEQLRATQQEVAKALISAEAFAFDLRRQAEAEDQEQRARNAALQQAESRRIQSIAKHIDALRREVRSAIDGMDQTLKTYSVLCRQLQTEADPQEDSAGAALNEEDVCRAGA